jgi:hypothetical protein
VIHSRFDFNTPVARHEFSLEYMDFALDLLSAPSPIRTTGSILQKIKSFLGMSVKMPSWYSIRLWLLKLGLFKLQQPKEMANDWIWIVDHSIQTGVEKCLVVLGIRAKDLPKNRALGLSDVEPLAVMPVTTSDKTVVYTQLNEVAHVTGVPYAIISDAGPDLKAGIDVYCAQNPYRTRHIYDVTHWIALQIKNLFEQDDSWMSFIEFTSLAQKFMRQTEVAALAPPNQRSKARYLNIDIIIRWAQRIMRLMESPDRMQSMFNPDLIGRTLMWIIHFKDDIREWGEILDVAEAIKSTISKKGLYRGLRNDLSKVLAAIPAESTRAIELQDAVLSYAGSLEYKVHVGDRLPGCSDVIESLFGRFKHLEQQQSGSGFTQLLLALPALVGKKSRELLKQAMETVKVSELSLWLKENIGMSVQAKRKLVFNTQLKLFKRK